MSNETERSVPKPEAAGEWRRKWDQRVPFPPPEMARRMDLEETQRSSRSATAK